MARVKNFLKENYKILLFLICLLIVNIFCLILACYTYNVAVGSKRFILMLALMLIVSVGLCVFLFFAKKKKWKIENIFLVVASTLGLLFLLAIPMGRTPDEPAHLKKIFSVAEGHIAHDMEQNGQGGNLLPENIASIDMSGKDYTKNAYSQIGQDLSQPVSDNIVFNATFTMCPINYIPQILGTLIGLIFHLPALLILYFARLCGLAACIAILYFCIKYIPILKKPLFFISCCPITFQALMGLSYDGMIFCAGIVLMSFILYCIYNKKFTLKIRHYLLILGASLLLVIVKPVYAPLCLLLFFIPARCFGSSKKKIVSIIAIGAVTILVFGAWMLVPVIPMPPGNGSDPNGQVNFILAHPFNFLIILFDNMVNMPIYYLQGANTLEWVDIPISQFYMIFILIMFVLLCINERITETLKKISFFRLACGICFVLIISLIFLAMYRGWTSVGNNIIAGVQSRYFLPIILLIPLVSLIPKNNKQTKQKPLLNDLVIYGSIVMINTSMLATIICSHL